MSSVNAMGSSNRAYRGHEDVLSIAKQGKADIKEQREGIRNNPDMTIAEKKEALTNLNRAEKQYDRVINNSTSGTGLMGKFADRMNPFERNAEMSWKMLESAEKSMAKVSDVIGDCAAVTQTNVEAPRKECGTGHTGNTGNTGNTENKGNTGDSGDAKVDAQNKAYNANFSGKEPEDLANWASADPKGFYENLKDLSPEDRQSTMMMMNQHLQDMNQMFSMMSNLSKAQHDTAKALINNMRV